MQRFSAMGLNFQKLSTFVSIALLQRSLKNDFTRLLEKIQIFQFFHTVFFFSTPVHVSGNQVAWRFDGRGVQAKSGSNLNNPTTWGLSFLMPAGELCSACVCVGGKSVKCSQSEQSLAKLGWAYPMGKRTKSSWSIMHLYCHDNSDLHSLGLLPHQD